MGCRSQSSARGEGAPFSSSSSRRASCLRGLALFASLGLAGCTSPVASGLDESQANAVLVALDRAGVFAEKEADPAQEGRFRVLVERGESARAIARMREEDLPPPASVGVLDSIGKGSLVPSQLAEHAQYVTGVAGELERSLRGIDGVKSARVHLSLPQRDAFSETPRDQASASVLIKHRGATTPIGAHELKLLVAGAAPGLDPEAVAVVLLPQPAPAPSVDRELARLGPIAVTRGSLRWLRLGIVVTALTWMAMAGAVLALWMKLRRLRAEAEVVEAPVEEKKAA